MAAVTKGGPSWEVTPAQLVRKCLSFVRLEISLQCCKQPTTEPCLEQGESSQQTLTVFLQDALEYYPSIHFLAYQVVCFLQPYQSNFVSPIHTT